MQKPKSNHAFTLLEMVLIMGVIVGVAGILMYASGPLKDGQNKTTCISNLKKLNDAVRIGAEIYNIPPGTHYHTYRNKIFGASGVLGKGMGSMFNWFIRCPQNNNTYEMRIGLTPDQENIKCRNAASHGHIYTYDGSSF